MDTMTINISLPKAMYADAKKIMAKQRYASFSEFLREQVRQAIYQAKGLTVNGFTPEFEAEVLRRANDPYAEVFHWDGKGSLHDFMMSNQPKRRKNDKH